MQNHPTLCGIHAQSGNSMIQASGRALLGIAPDDRWYATNGVMALGPVAFDVIRRGLATGQIPIGALVRHESWKVWRTFEDIESLSPGSRLQTIEYLATLSASTEERAVGPTSEPPPPPARAELATKSSPDSNKRPSLRPAAVDPVGVLQNSRTLEQALLLTLSTAVTAAGGHAGLLHQLRPELGGFVTAFAQGPGGELLLGEKLSGDDAALAAARAGYTVVSEPFPGDAGRYVLGRISRCLGNVCSFAMVPFTLHGRLHGMLELGRELRPFRARDVARVEDVVDALVERVLYMGWIE